MHIHIILSIACVLFWYLVMEYKSNVYIGVQVFGPNVTYYYNLYYNLNINININSLYHSLQYILQQWL